MAGDAKKPKKQRLKRIKQLLRPEYFADRMNKKIYFDVYDLVRQNFAAYPNVECVRGVIPESFAGPDIERVAFLSIDLNNSPAEVATLEHFRPKTAPSAMIVLDDYGWAEHGHQKAAIDELAGDFGMTIATLPTGQGLIVKPA